MSEANVKTIERIYEAFGRGDVAGLPGDGADDRRWDFNGGVPEVPWHGPFVGKAAVPRFLAAFMEHVALEAFEPRRFMASGADVVVHLRLAYTVRKTGKRVDEEQLQWWT